MTLPLLLALAASGCIEVDGPAILARDLARAHPAWAGLPPETPLGFTPAPGARRLLDASELKRLAGPGAPALEATGPVCVVRATGILSPAEALAAMRVSLGEAAHIEIVEVSLFPVPRGEVVFPKTGLSRPARRDSAQPALWRGYVRYDERRRAPVWAKVRVSVRTVRVVAARDLRAGQVIDAAWLRLEDSGMFPPSDPLAESVEEVAGRVLKAGVVQGAPVPRRIVAASREVERGDRVQVEAAFGAARVAVAAEAETAGARGDTVVVRNLQSGKRFRARVEGKGRVALQAARGAKTWDTQEN